MITYPYEHPIAAASFTSNTPDFQSEAGNFKTHLSEIPSHRWEVSITTVELDVDDHRDFWGWLNSIGGRGRPFDVVLPIYSTPRGVANGSPLVYGGTSGSKEATLYDCPPSVIKWLRRGDHIRFGTHTKVYQVSADVDTQPDGKAVIALNTYLQQGIGEGTSVIIRDVPFTLKLKNQVQEFDIDASNGRFVQIEMECAEYL